MEDALKLPRMSNKVIFYKIQTQVLSLSPIIYDGSVNHERREPEGHIHSLVPLPENAENSASSVHESLKCKFHGEVLEWQVSSLSTRMADGSTSS
eukprot:751964-Hanusia_phi.AAC.1